MDIMFVLYLVTAVLTTIAAVLTGLLTFNVIDVDGRFINNQVPVVDTPSTGRPALPARPPLRAAA